MVLHVAVVKESDYPLLAPICVASVARDNYAAFLEGVEEHCQERAAMGITCIKTYIDPAAFKIWFRGTYATRSDLSSYAASIVNS